MMCGLFRRSSVPATISVCLLLIACAQLHPAVAALQWQDQWGERGRQVLARDHAMCERLVEHRRSQLGACLAARRWSL